jgi:ABC-2 type transport system ATP-binding protein
MIQTEELTKKYGKLTAVQSLNLNIEPGEIYGFLGPNGAGKTTTIMMLIGILRPTSGEIYLFGERYSPQRLDLRRRIGVVPEKHPEGMWTWMTAREYLQTFADLFSLKNPAPRINQLLERVGLGEVGNKRFSEFSHGMLQKLSIVRALLHEPEILILDEPISGLDPFGVKQIRDLILEENRKGRTIFISSHVLSEMEKICHRVAIILGGKLLAEERMDTLLNTLVKEREVYVGLESVPDGLVSRVKELPFVIDAVQKGEGLLIKVQKSGDYRKELSKYFINLNLVPLSIQEKSLSLEDAFITITNENIDLFTATVPRS